MDGHKKPETKKKRRKQLVSECLENELRMHHWVQLPEFELKDLEEELEIKVGDGCQHADVEPGVAMVGLHVDSHPSFHKKMSATTMFGGNLSVRKPPSAKPLIGFGQREWIFKQHLFTSKA